MALVAGIDSSTQSCKVVIRDADTGALVRQGRASHPDGSEVHPDHWWTALQEALRQAGGLADVSAVSVGGQQHGMVCLDVTGEVIRPALLWNDTRSAPAALDLIREAGGGDPAEGARYWSRATGTVPVASLTITKLRWLARNEPDNASRVAAVCLPHDWLSWRLAGYGPGSGEAGLAALRTDRSDASGTGYYSAPAGQYLPDALEKSLGHVPRLPAVVGPLDIAGKTPDGCAHRPGRRGQRRRRPGRRRRRGRRGDLAGHVRHRFCRLSHPGSRRVRACRRICRRHRQLPAAGLHPERNPRLRCHGRAAGRQPGGIQRTGPGGPRGSRRPDAGSLLRRRTDPEPSGRGRITARHHPGKLHAGEPGARRRRRRGLFPRRRPGSPAGPGRGGPARHPGGRRRAVAGRSAGSQPAAGPARLCADARRVRGRRRRPPGRRCAGRGVPGLDPRTVWSCRQKRPTAASWPGTAGTPPPTSPELAPCRQTHKRTCTAEAVQVLLLVGRRLLP